MSTGRVMFAIARADLLERVRRYSFFVTLVSAMFLGYAAATGKILLKLGDYRGIYTSGWIGTMVALVTTTFASLIGFYIVKNAVDRDRQTGVGQILATTPLSKSAYTIGKVISNFAVLATIVLVLALTAMVMLTFFREDRRVDLWALLSPFLLIALPAMAVTAAIAVLFETIPVLRGGVGNVVWFFGWSFGVALPAVTEIRWMDPAGLWTVAESMMAAAREVIPGYKGEFSLTIGDRGAVLVNSLRWSGMHWTSEQILLRMTWMGIAFMIALLAAVFFDRFDPARSRQASAPTKSKTAPLSDEVAAEEGLEAVGRGVTKTHLTPLPIGPQSGGFVRLFVVELRLALKGFPWWWYAVAAGLLIAQLVSPLEITRGPLLATAWIWPLLMWSAMGTRESRYGTSALLFSSARILLRQFPACFLVGVAVAAVAGAGAAVRLLIVENQAGLLGWTAGVLFVPSLALALGVWTGTSKAYEGLFTVLWYVGPMNHVPGLDYTGAANGARTVSYAVVYFVLAAVLLFSAFARRAGQLRRA